ncbi:MAG: hypothetical protein ACYC9Z_01555 [Casimicrobiaceae bacterium]
MDRDMQHLPHNIEPELRPRAIRVAHTPLVLDAETLVALKELGNALAAVRRRLISEGYVIQKGRYATPGKDH